MGNIFSIEILYNLSLFLALAILWFIAKRIYSKKKMLYPFSGFIFLINIFLVLALFFNLDIFESNNVFLFFTAFVLFSLSSSDNQNVLNNKIRDTIYFNFKKLSFGDNFFNNEDIIKFFIKDYKLTFFFFYINNFVALLIYIAFTTSMYISVVHETNYHIYALVFIYFIYFVFTYLSVKNIDFNQTKFNFSLENMIKSSENSKIIDMELSFSGDSCYFGKDFLILFDGGQNSYCFSTKAFSQYSREELDSILKEVDSSYKNSYN